jgi:ribosomal protein L2
MSKNNLSTYYKVYKNFLKKIENKNINYKPLITGLLKKTGGRNNTGKITAYHRGGGVKRLYKKVLYSYLDLLKCNLQK